MQNVNNVKEQATSFWTRPSMIQLFTLHSRLHCFVFFFFFLRSQKATAFFVLL